LISSGESSKQAEISKACRSEEIFWRKEAEEILGGNQQSKEGEFDLRFDLYAGGYVTYFLAGLNEDIIMVPRINHSIDLNLSVLEEYKGTARLLQKLGYYKGLTTAIESCIRNENTFVLIDCPSGAGKTLAGVALSLMDHRRNPEASIGGGPVAVVHLVWPCAVNSQPI
jgi:hypothetical protein